MAEAPDPGSAHLRWITRFQVLLLPIGALAWLLRGPRAALAFAAGACASLAFWALHRVIVAHMLTPKVRLRWFYGVLAALKLALIALVLRGMMMALPAEGLPLATGLLLFVVGILLEALRIACTGEAGTKAP